MIDIHETQRNNLEIFYNNLKKKYRIKDGFFQKSTSLFYFIFKDKKIRLDEKHEAIFASQFEYYDLVGGFDVIIELNLYDKRDFVPFKEASYGIKKKCYAIFDDMVKKNVLPSYATPSVSPAVRRLDTTITIEPADNYDLTLTLDEVDRFTGKLAIYLSRASGKKKKTGFMGV